jgi:signal transduction histidine kinase
MSLNGLKARNKTIGFKLTLWYSGFFVLSASLLFGLAYVFLSQTLERDDHLAIRAQLKQVSTIYARRGMSGVESELVAGKKYRKRSPFFFRFASQDNNTIRVFFPRRWREFDLSRLEVAPPEERTWITVPAKGGQAGYVLEVASTRLPDGTWLQVGMSTESRRRVLSRFLESFAYVVGFLLLVGVVSGYSLSRRALRPVRHLIHTVRSIESGQMDVRVPQPEAQDELGELVRLFNTMLERIEALIEGMKGSLDQVAHDLRTPMTRMHNIAETALQSGDNPERCRRALEDFAEESNRILQMLNTLMDISEAETGAMTLDRKTFRVRELVDPVVEVYSYIAEEKGIGIRTEVSEDLVAEADFNRISQALANLLDNAIKHTPPHSPPLSVWAGRAGGEVIIAVTDHGTGIDEGELSKIWDRLYRGSAKRDTSDKGLGLGLAQVRAIIRAHGGRVDVASHPGQGSTFRIRLPQ